MGGPIHDAAPWRYVGETDRRDTDGRMEHTPFPSPDETQGALNPNRFRSQVQLFQSS